MIKAKKGFLLRRLGAEYMVVAIGEARRNFNGMLRMNDTGAFSWQVLENCATEDARVEQTQERFPDVDADPARRDVHTFLQSISIALDHDPSDD